MEQMKKSSSKAFTIIFILLGLVATGALYYFFVFAPTTTQIDQLQSEQTNVQMQIDALTVKAQLLTKMKHELPELRENNRPIAAYDNLKPVMAALNNIMMASQQFEVSFGMNEKPQQEEGQEAAQDKMVRRQVTIGFVCNNYQDAKNIIDNLYNIGFRCQINQATLTSAKNGESGMMGSGNSAEGDLNKDLVQGNVSIVFFETLKA